MDPAARPSCTHTERCRIFIPISDIAAPAFLVWAILADFGTYRRWNPLIRGVLGRAVSGRRIEIQLRGSSGADRTSRAFIARLREPHEMKWVESWRPRGLFSSERRLWIETPPRGGVRFHHGEQVRGMLAPIPAPRHRVRTQSGFDAMSTALKERAERAWAQGKTAGAVAGA